MEHAEVAASQITERYLLGELSAAEADAFEEHYFECGECAEDVRAGAALMEGGGALAHERAEPQPALAPPVSMTERRSRFADRFRAAAIAAMLAIPLTALPFLMRRPAPMVAVVEPVFLGGATRGEEPVVVQLDPGGAGTFHFQIPDETTRTGYEVRVIAPGGKTLLTRALPPDAPEKEFSIVLARVEPGTYELVITGSGPAGQTAEISRRQFLVKR